MNPRKYDWDRLFAERRFRLRFGQDYRCSQSSIIQQVRNAAALRRLSVEVEDERTSVAVTATPKEEAHARAS